MVWVWDEGADEQDGGIVSMCHLHSVSKFLAFMKRGVKMGGAG